MQRRRLLKHPRKTLIERHIAELRAEFQFLDNHGEQSHTRRYQERLCAAREKVKLYAKLILPHFDEWKIFDEFNYRERPLYKTFTSLDVLTELERAVSEIKTSGVSL